MYSCAPSWSALFGPAGLPADVVQKLNQAFVKVVADPGVQKFMTDSGTIPVTSTPERLRAFVQEQIGLWGRWSKDAGITPQ